LSTADIQNPNSGEQARIVIVSLGCHNQDIVYIFGSFPDGGVPMDFIGKIFGISPDGGSGTLEVLFVASIVLQTRVTGRAFVDT
jgi:hypothetical protein